MLNERSKGPYEIKTKVEVLLQVLIFYSVGIYIFEIHCGAHSSQEGHPFFLWSERLVAALFTVEYICRLCVARDKIKHMLSAYAIIDLIAILPFYLGFLVDLRSLRLIRTMRLARILKLTRYSSAVSHVIHCFRNVKRELQIIGALIVFFLIFGSTAIVEAERIAQPDKFSTLADGLWWSVVTLTTVGYGDSFPITASGRLVAIVLIMSGLGIFGTFVSLIGSAFVEAVRVNKEQNGLDVVLSPCSIVALKRFQADQGGPTDRTSLIKLADKLIEDKLAEKTAKTTSQCL